MDRTMPAEHFQSAYLAGDPPWVIGEPQPAVVDLERAGWITDPVLDLGCGAGEHTALLTRLGHRTVGADAAPAALERARATARVAEVEIETAVVDALDPAGRCSIPLGPFATVLDSALFHVFAPDDRARYVRALTGLVEPGGQVVVLGLSTEGAPFGPQISDDDIRGAFTAPTWTVESLERSTYRGRVTRDEHAASTGRPIGALVDMPAWLARIRRA